MFPKSNILFVALMLVVSIAPATADGDAVARRVNVFKKAKKAKKDKKAKYTTDPTIDQSLQQCELNLKSAEASVQDLLEHVDQKEVPTEDERAPKKGDDIVNYFGYTDSDTGKKYLLKRVKHTVVEDTEGNLKFKHIESTLYNGYLGHHGHTCKDEDDPICTGKPAEAPDAARGLQGGGLGYAKVALKATKLAWDIIKANKPVTDIKDDSEFHLIAPGTNVDDYYNEVNCSSDSYFFIGVLSPDIQNVQILGQLAEGPDPGKFLVNTYVNVGGVSEFWGWTVTGTANIGFHSNVGSEDSPIAQVQVEVKFNLSCDIDDTNISLLFTAQGDSCSSFTYKNQS